MPRRWASSQAVFHFLPSNVGPSHTAKLDGHSIEESKEGMQSNKRPFVLLIRAQRVLFAYDDQEQRVRWSNLPVGFVSIDSMSRQY